MDSDFEVLDDTRTLLVISVSVSASMHVQALICPRNTYLGRCSSKVRRKVSSDFEVLEWVDWLSQSTEVEMRGNMPIGNVRLVEGAREADS